MDTATFDPVAYITGALSELDAAAARAVEAARNHRPGDALQAARTMLSLLQGRREIMDQIETMARSKRVPHTVRRAIKAAAQPWMLSIERRVRTLKALMNARRARVDAMCGALRQATTTHSVYTAKGRLGPRMVMQTTHHVVALTA